jgi:N-acetyl sugar amidotransferase
MINNPDIQICTRCIYDSNLSNITFDEKGICNYCYQVESLKKQYGTGTEVGRGKLSAILKKIKSGHGSKKYDCVVGVSGGTDSSYLLMKCVDWGLRPLAVHYDNTWNTAISTQNIRKITNVLKVDLHTYVIDNKEANSIYKATLKSGVLEWDASTDIAFVQVLRSFAAKYSIKYILEGHSFTAEGLSPVGNNYFDGKYVASVFAKYGEGKLKTFPNLTFFQFMKWTLLYNQQFLRPLWYLEYGKEAAQKELSERTGWQNYGGHHLENRAAVFGHTVWLPERYGLDFRNLTLSAKVRAGILDRGKALRQYQTSVKRDPEIVEYVLKRLGVTEEEFNKYMLLPKQSFREFKTYKKRFEILRPLFYILAKTNRVPMSFYLKYCFPIKEIT